MSNSKKKGKKDETVKAASGSRPPSPPISSLKFFIAHSSEALMSQGTSNPNHTYIYLDSGASTHMCHDRSYFTLYRKLDPPKIINTANGPSKAYGIGDIEVRTYLDGKPSPGLFRNVLYLPSASEMLMLVAQLSDSGIMLIHPSNHVIDLVDHHTNEVLTQAHQEQNLYQIWVEIIKPEKAMSACKPRSSKAPLSLWHCCLGHISEETIQNMAKEGVITGMEVEGPGSGNCSTCLKGKQMQSNIPHVTEE